jgi:hypothetical protein
MRLNTLIKRRGRAFDLSQSTSFTPVSKSIIGVAFAGKVKPVTIYTSLRKEPVKDGNGFFTSEKRKAGQEVESAVIEVVSSGVENHRRGDATFSCSVVECEISVGNRVVTPLVG